MKKLFLVFLSVSVVLGVGCSTKKKKTAAAVEVPPDTPPPTLPTPPAQEPAKPQDPSKPTTPSNPNNPTPTPSPTTVPDVPLDRRGTPIVPSSPLSTSPHLIMKNGEVQVVPNMILTAEICQDRMVKYFYTPCSLYLCAPRQQCGYFVCVNN